MSGQQAGGHYAVDLTGLPYRPAGAFDYDEHDRWVEAGHCPAVGGKTWCSRPPGHWPATPHAAPFIPAEGAAEVMRPLG